MVWIYVLIALAGAAACIAVMAHSARGLVSEDEDAPKPSILAMPGLLAFDLAALLAPVVLAAVVPSFAAMFSEFEAELPMLTKLVLSSAMLFRGFGGLILYIGIVAGLVFGTHQLLHRLPRKLGLVVLLGGGFGAFVIGASILVGLYAPLFSMSSGI
jgi:hypothetical protein